MKLKAYTAEGAVSVGPYSHGIDAGDLVFLSGQTPIDSSTGKLVEGDISAQTQQCFNNLFLVLKAAKLNPSHVVKVNVFLTDMNNFAAMNEVYKQQFTEPYPARTTIGVAGLPLNAQVEIEMIARKR
jgi:2-iminobutanoate/2-iminopropanoate deaminase